MFKGLLVASPQMRDPFFSGTVVLLCQHDDDGALGIVVNRETSLNVKRVTESMEIEAPLHEDAPVMWGGPVEPGAGFVVYRGAGPEDEGWQISADVTVSPSRDRLASMLQQQAIPFYLCLGYAGWGPQQLEDEIKEGSWLCCETDAILLFDTPLDNRYDQALASFGVDPNLVWMQPVDE